jgi:hypothetical protein
MWFSGIQSLLPDRPKLVETFGGFTICDILSKSGLFQAYSQTSISGKALGRRKPISGRMSVCSDSFYRQNVHRLGGLSCKRQLHACCFPSRLSKFVCMRGQDPDAQCNIGADEFLALPWLLQESDICASHNLCPKNGYFLCPKSMFSLPKLDVCKLPTTIWPPWPLLDLETRLMIKCKTPLLT